uniref:Secreted protein n=1 Tax=Gongylonema pulchrum TaxID=637853 RepID=A0A183EUA2_9BILA
LSSWSRWWCCCCCCCSSRCRHGHIWRGMDANIAVT